MYLLLAAIGICPRAATGSCLETAAFVTEGDDGLSADVPGPSFRAPVGRRANGVLSLGNDRSWALGGWLSQSPEQRDVTM
jgi:hypothetical protein